MTRIESFEELKGAKFFMFNPKSGGCTAYNYCCDGMRGDKDSIYCWNIWTGDMERVCRGDMKRYRFYRRDHQNKIEILEVIEDILSERLERIGKIVELYYQKREDEMHFNIEKWKEGCPVCTRDGENVKILTTERFDDEYPIVAMVGDEEMPMTYTMRGEVMKGCVNPDDLRMCPEGNNGWGKVYEEMEGE